MRIVVAALAGAVSGGSRSNSNIFSAGARQAWSHCSGLATFFKQ
jgi:hypothetical protein